MKSKNILFLSSALSAVFFLAVLANYLYFSIFVDNPKEVTVNGVKFHVSYETRPIGKGTEALTTIWKGDDSGQRKVIEIFRNIDSDNHLGTVTPPSLFFYDCNGDGKKDLCRIDTGVFVDLSKETIVEQAEIKLPYLYKSYIKWHSGWPFEFPKYSYIVPIFITSIILWFLLVGILYLVRKLYFRRND